MIGTSARWLAAGASALLVAGVTVAVVGSGSAPESIIAASTTATSTSTTTTSSTSTTSTTAPPAPPPPPTTRPKPPPPARSTTAFTGLGTWVDVYDWSAAFTKGQPTVGPAQVDDMARRGVQTLYLQVSKHESPDDVMEPGLLNPIIDRAHQKGLRVVAWYLPTLEDPGRDAARLAVIARLKVEAIGIDIESTKVADAAERSRRLVDVSHAVRKAAPRVTLAAIVMTPVATEVINPAFWPGFPYRQIAPLYDVWMTMGYWSYRTPESGYRDAYRYTAESVTRLRSLVGRPDLPVHPIGDAGSKPGSTVPASEVDAYRRAVADHRGLGASLYDYRLTTAEHWAALQGARS